MKRIDNKESFKIEGNGVYNNNNVDFSKNKSLYLFLNAEKVNIETNFSKIDDEIAKIIISGGDSQ